MCGGGVPDGTPVMEQEGINSDHRRNRHNPWIHAPIDAPHPTVLPTVGESPRRNELPPLLPHLGIDMNRD